MLAPYHHVRMTTVCTGSTNDAEGRAHPYAFEVHLLRSGEFASLRRRCRRRRAGLPGPSATFDRGPRLAGRPPMAGRGRVEADPRAVSPSRPRSHRPLRCRRARLRGAARGHVKRSCRSRPRRRHRGGVRAVRRERKAPGAGPPRGPLVGRVGALALGDVRPGRGRPLRGAVPAIRGRRAGQEKQSIRLRLRPARGDTRAALGAHLGGLARREARDERLEGRRPPLRADPRGGVRPRSVPRRPPGRGTGLQPLRRRTLDARADGSGCPCRSVRSAWSAARCCHSGRSEAEAGPHPILQPAVL